ncbi:MAG: hypothetical protein DDT30_02088 [Dehalococcoidia bacterium]|nr:hypothetical protein [Bacillota bacterium]MBT9144119.1 hypothetical protein [Bacillota bacterium]
MKTGKRETRVNWAELAEKSHKYEQKLILAELKKLTDSMKKLERRIANLERKLVN